MIAYPENLADSLEHEAIDPAAVDLSAPDLAESAQFSQAILQPDMQWQNYLNGLAVAGFEGWLAERSPDLQLDQQHSTLQQPAYANLLPAVCNLQVGGFKLCLLAVGSLWDEVVSIPSAAVDLAQFVPHLYVLIQVEEEAGQVMVQGCLRQDQLAQRRQSLEAAEDWTYPVPLGWFDLNADNLLLYLRCLDAAAIALPTPRSEPSRLPELQQRLQSLQPLLQADTAPLWQRLPWSLGAELLRQPAWVNWLYQFQQGQNLPLPAVAVQLDIAQAAINAGQWLRNRLDQTAAHLSWQLLPPLRPATAMRSSATEIESVLSELERNGVQLVSQARGAYRDISWENGVLRLYAIAWALPADTAEWSLLVVLGPQPGDRLSPGTALRIRDAEQLLVEHTLQPGSADSYLYGQIIGTLDEQFWVSIALPSGTVIALPAIAFIPDHES